MISVLLSLDFHAAIQEPHGRIASSTRTHVTGPCGWGHSPAAYGECYREAVRAARQQVWQGRSPLDHSSVPLRSTSIPPLPRARPLAARGARGRPGRGGRRGPTPSFSPPSLLPLGPGRGAPLTYHTRAEPLTRGEQRRCGPGPQPGKLGRLVPPRARLGQGPRVHSNPSGPAAKSLPRTGSVPTFLARTGELGRAWLIGSTRRQGRVAANRNLGPAGHAGRGWC